MNQQGTPEWVAERREYIGASDLPSILGLGYRSEWDLVLEKRGLTTVDETWAMTWGHHVQRLAADLYRDLTGHRCRNVNVTHRHPRYPHVRASLDLRVVGQPKAVEVKWTSKRLTEPMPAWIVQCYGQLGVTGLEAVDILKVSAYEPPVIWTVERDEAAITDLMETAEAWYVRHVLEGVDPPLDGSRAASRHLDALRGEAEAQASREQETMLGELRAVRVRMAADEDTERRIVTALKASMAGTGVLVAPGARVTWAATKGRSAVDWQAVAHVMYSLAGVAPELYDEEVARHTSVGEPSTRFAVKFEEEEGA